MVCSGWFSCCSVFGIVFLGSAACVAAQGSESLLKRGPGGIDPPHVGFAAASALRDGAIRLQDAEGPRRGRGALWGAGIGLVAGGLLGGLTVGSDEDVGGSLVESAATGEAVLLGAALGGAVGALLGATVFAPGGEAPDSDRAAPSVAIRPWLSPERVGLAARVAW